MIPPPGEERHPAELELRHYLRGSLDPGHAVAVLAHCLICADCLARLRRELGRTRIVRRTPPRRGEHLG